MLIGITGYARNGKDSVADILVNKFGYKKYSLAGKMKECLTTIFGWSKEFIENYKDEVDDEWGISPRQVLQVFGTEFAQYTLGEKFPAFKEKTGRKLWVRSLLDTLPDFEHTVIPDVRFPHEEEEIRAYHGKIIRVFGQYPECPKPNLKHESESSVDCVNFDIGISNDTTLKSLEDTVIYSASYVLKLDCPKDRIKHDL
jgi:hypothetical protein